MTSEPAIVKTHRRLVTMLLFMVWIGPMLFVFYLMWRDPHTALMLVCLSHMVALAACAATLSEAWFRPRLWELNGAVYERLGVRRFKRFMIGGDQVNRRVRYLLPDYRTYAAETTLQQLSADTRAVEKGHALWGLIALPAVAFAVFTGWTLFGVAFTLVNVGANLYPILLQRDTRARIARIASRRHSHGSLE